METLRDLVELIAVVDATYDQNCYVLRRRDSDRVLVVDPGLQHAALLEHLERNGLRCDRVLLTHGHPDHVNGVPFVTAAHACPAAIHPADRPMLDFVGMLPGIPRDLPPVRAGDDLGDGAVIEWEGVTLTVLHTPGHTPGSVCFLLGDELCAGDTLFRRGVGRVDLPGGSWEALVDSISRRLYTLPAETVVHPGHGPGTTIGEEQRGNPFVVHPRYR